MIVAESEELGRIYSGPEIRQQSLQMHHSGIRHDFRCPICQKRVVYAEEPLGCTFDHFHHADGSADCFETDSVSDEHRIATEITVKTLHNRLREVTGEKVEIDVERWVGVQQNFIIADVRVSAPLRVAAEVYYKTEPLALGRRLNTMFENDYRAYLIFHRDGLHDVDKVERYLQRVAPLGVGRFDPESLKLTLGDLFTEEQIDLSPSNLDQLPDYIAR